MADLRINQVHLVAALKMVELSEKKPADILSSIHLMSEDEQLKKEVFPTSNVKITSLNRALNPLTLYSKSGDKVSSMVHMNDSINTLKCKMLYH